MNQQRIGKRTFIAAGVGALALAALPLAAQQKPPIKLGVITILSGPLATYGKSQELLAKMAAEDINAKGGINGSMVQLAIEDAQLDPGQAVLMLRKLHGDGYFGAIGPVTGTQWETASPLANQIQMPSISVNAAKPGITVKPWTIRLVPADDTAQPAGFNDFIKLHPNVKRGVILADVREATGRSVADDFARLAKAAGVQIVDVVEFSTRATDLSPAAIKAKGANPDVLFVAAFAPSAVMLAKEFAAQGMKVPVLASSILWPGPFINQVGENGRNWYTWGYTTNDRTTGDKALHESIVKRALARADTTLGTPFNVSNWSVTYDALMLYADILRRNGFDGSSDPKKVRETIKDEFVKLKSYSGVNRYTMRDTGDADVPTSALVTDIDAKVWRYPK